MTNRSIYLSEEEESFVKHYLDDFPEWIKEKIREEMHNCPEYCQKKITYFQEQMTTWTEKMEKANKEKTDYERSIRELISNCKERKDTVILNEFLSGKTGKKLLKQCNLSKKEFLKRLKEGKYVSYFD